MKSEYIEGFLSAIITISSLICLFCSLYVIFSNVSLNEISISNGNLLFQDIINQVYSITLKLLHSALFWVLAVLTFIFMLLGIRIYTVYQ